MHVGLCILVDKKKRNRERQLFVCLMEDRVREREKLFTSHCLNNVHVHYPHGMLSSIQCGRNNSYVEKIALYIFTQKHSSNYVL